MMELPKTIIAVGDVLRKDDASFFACVVVTGDAKDDAIPAAHIAAAWNACAGIDTAHLWPGVMGEMAEALAWYGEQARLARLITTEGDAGRHAIDGDGGNKARAILAKLNSKEAK